MHIVPVIDLMRGRVVHARAGDRDHYPHLQSCLAPSCEPLSVVAALLELYPFESLYVADLDAILGRRNHQDIIGDISRKFPQLHLWIDAGASTPSFVKKQHENLTAVIGTESFTDPLVLRETLDKLNNPILSLDFKHNRFVGHESVLHNPEIWPHRLIRMDLDRVGKETGLDNRGCEWLQQHFDHEIYLAGGISHAGDIVLARQSGAAGVLLASALHDGRITATDLGSVYHATSRSRA